VDAVTASLHQVGLERVEFGDFSRIAPTGSGRGADPRNSLDRCYIEQFLMTHAGDIRGRVLEAHDDRYTQQYGGGRVTHSDVIDISPMNRRATVVDDVRNAMGLKSQSYDCLILIHTLHAIYDMRAVLAEAARVLAPGGVVLATVASVGRPAPGQGLDNDFWRFTAAAARRLFSEFFPTEGVTVYSYGNVLVDISYLYGLDRDELSKGEREVHDPYFPLVVGVRART
jgi:SAM-dependent methyltransferase